MNNFPDPNAVRFLHESVVNRFIKLLAMSRLGDQAGDFEKLEKVQADIREEDIVINPARKDA